MQRNNDNTKEEMIHTKLSFGERFWGALESLRKRGENPGEGRMLEVCSWEINNNSIVNHKTSTKNKIKAKIKWL